MSKISLVSVVQRSELADTVWNKAEICSSRVAAPLHTQICVSVQEIHPVAEMCVNEYDINLILWLNVFWLLGG